MVLAAELQSLPAQATLELQRFDLARDDLMAALKLNPSDEKAQRMLDSLTPG